MKTTTFLTSLLFSAAIAQDAQVPLKEKAAAWFDKAKSYIPSGTPETYNPVHAGAAAVAANKVQKINSRNYQRLLQPKLEGEEEWIIYLTGGNKSCFGLCGPTDLAFNESTALFSALPQAANSPSLHLARVDCEKEAVLCSSWAAACPSIFHFLFPQAQPGQTNPPSPLRVVGLNRTTTTAQTILKLASSAPGSTIMEVPEYTGLLHPVDGTLAKFGLQEYLGYVIWLMGSTPSWLVMIVISFVSRQIMSRRAIGNRGNIYGAPGTGAAPAGGAGSAPAPAAAKPATPASAGKGGKKRR